MYTSDVLSLTALSVTGRGGSFINTGAHVVVPCVSRMRRPKGPSLSPFISQNPPLTYRRTRSLKNALVQSEFTGNFRKDPCKSPGTFKCDGCRYCQYMHTGSNIRLPNSTKFEPTHYANCKTIGVVYMLYCQCRSFYIGKTKQEFHKRMYRHILGMQKSNPDRPLGRHVRDNHGGKFPQIKFLILD